MNKPLLAGAGVTLVALGVAPYFIGTSVHENVNAAVNEINQQAVYSAEVLSYDKGWFSTTAEIKLAVDFQALINAQNVDSTDIPMEERSPEEVTRIKGVQFTIEDIDVTTPAFDVTPAELIHGIITEKGIATYPYKKSLEEQRNAN